MTIPTDPTSPEVQPARQATPLPTPLPCSTPPERCRLLTTRALLLLLVAVFCGLAAVHSVTWAIGIGTAAAVLTLLERLVTD